MDLKGEVDKSHPTKLINVLFESSRKRLFFLDNTHSSQHATPKLLAILAELVINTRTPCADYKHKVKINFIYYNNITSMEERNIGIFLPSTDNFQHSQSFMYKNIPKSI